MATAAELLSSVDEAISFLTTNRYQSIKVDGQEYNYVDLGELRRWRNQLQREVAQQKSRRRGMLSQVRWGKS